MTDMSTCLCSLDSMKGIDMFLSSIDDNYDDDEDDDDDYDDDDDDDGSMMDISTSSIISLSLRLYSSSMSAHGCVINPILVCKPILVG